MNMNNMVIGATAKSPGVRMAFYKNTTQDLVEVFIGEAPGQPVNVYRAAPGGVVLGPANYIEAFERGKLTQISDEEGEALQSRQNKVMQAVSSMSPEEVEKLLAGAQAKADAGTDAPPADPVGPPTESVAGVVIKKAK